MINYDELDDDGKLNQRYYNKKFNARKEKIAFELTFDEYCELLQDAGICSSDLGIKKYHLSRHNDSGGYTVGNCEFKWYLDNLSERKVSDKSRKASANNIKLAHWANLTEEQKLCRRKALSESFRKSGRKPPEPVEKVSMQQIFETMRENNINLNNWGSLAQLAKRLDISPQALGRRMKRKGLR